MTHGSKHQVTNGPRLMLLSTLSVLLVRENGVEKEKYNLTLHHYADCFYLCKRKKWITRTVRSN